MSRTFLLLLAAVCVFVVSALVGVADYRDQKTQSEQRAQLAQSMGRLHARLDAAERERAEMFAYLKRKLGP